jgi:2-phosphosulfolactate phosphatase
MPNIETIFSPAVFPLFSEGIEEKNVVVIDILRATTTICIAFENGVREMVPVSTPEEALEFQKQGYIPAAERQGETVPGFTLGNSPQDYTVETVKDKKIAITTTNGTRALKLSEAGFHILIGSFINISAVVKFLKEDQKDVLLFCAGWKDKFNLEDTLYAGAVAHRLIDSFTTTGDSTYAAIDLFKTAANNMHEYLQKASHVNRFKTLHVESDLDICLQQDKSEKIPFFKGGIINLLQ